MFFAKHAHLVYYYITFWFGPFGLCKNHGQPAKKNEIIVYIFFSYEFQVKESEVIVAGGYLEVGGTILRDTDRYALKENGGISKQETGFLQKPRKYHRLTFLQILKSMLINEICLQRAFVL